MPEHQLRRQQTFLDQALRAVEVGEHGIEQTRTLGDTGRQMLPLIGSQHMGQQVQLPRAIGALGVGVNVIGHAVFLDLPGQQRLALGQLRRGAALQVIQQALPVGTHRAAVIEQFVISARGQRVTVEQVGHGTLGRGKGESV